MLYNYPVNCKHFYQKNSYRSLSNFSFSKLKHFTATLIVLSPMVALKVPCFSSMVDAPLSSPPHAVNEKKRDGNIKYAQKLKTISSGKLNVAESDKLICVSFLPLPGLNRVLLHIRNVRVPPLICYNLFIGIERGSSVRRETIKFNI
mgnify:CR=1 FL=1